MKAKHDCFASLKYQRRCFCPHPMPTCFFSKQPDRGLKSNSPKNSITDIVALDITPKNILNKTEQTYQNSSFVVLNAVLLSEEFLFLRRQSTNTDRSTHGTEQDRNLLHTTFNSNSHRDLIPLFLPSSVQLGIKVPGGGLSP